MPTTVQTDASVEDQLVEAFKLSDHAANGATSALRREAIERFEALGLPSKKLEFWKYTDIGRVLRRGDYRPALSAEPTAPTPEAVAALRIPDLDAHLAVTVNGRFSEALSDVDALPNGAVVTSLADAAANHVGTFERHYGRYAEFEDRALTALNTAFAADGVFIHVPEGVTLEKPVLLLHLTTGEENVLVQPRHLFVIENGATARIIERQATRTAAKVFTNGVTEVFVGARAHLDHYHIQDEGEHASQVQDLRAYQEEQSVFDTLTATLSGEVVRNNITVWPDAEHCETHLFGLYLAGGEMHVDNHTIAEHAAPNCFSNELYKGLLGGRATGVFNGRVHVHPDAQKINAYQSNKNIVLTDEASIYSKPELEIYADDVQCSHGSTTGRLDGDALFYLRSRGIPEVKARRLLLRAFAGDVVKEVKIDALRSWLDDEVAGRFKG